MSNDNIAILITIVIYIHFCISSACAHSLRAFFLFLLRPSVRNWHHLTAYIGLASTLSECKKHAELGWQIVKRQPRIPLCCALLSCHRRNFLLLRSAFDFFRLRSSVKILFAIVHTHFISLPKSLAVLIWLCWSCHFPYYLIAIHNWIRLTLVMPIITVIFNNCYFVCKLWPNSKPTRISSSSKSVGRLFRCILSK